MWKNVNSLLLAAALAIVSNGAPFNPMHSKQFSALARGECTGLRIESPNVDSFKNEPLILKAMIEDVPKDSKLEYIWTANRGKIKNGQGTSSIALEVERNRNSITVEVEIKGLPDGCPNKTAFSVHYD